MSTENQEIQSFRRVFDPQMIIALCVVVISVCALFVSIYQSVIMREQQDLMLEQMKAADWPRLVAGLSSSTQNEKVSRLEIIISNKGNGPAIIEGVMLTIDSTAYPEWDFFLNQLINGREIPYSYSNHQLNNTVLLPGEEVPILSFNDNTELAQVFYDQITRMGLQVCYRSVYHDFWKLSLTGTDQTSKTSLVPSCDIPVEKIFIQ